MELLVTARLLTGSLKSRERKASLIFILLLISTACDCPHGLGVCTKSGEMKCIFRFFIFVWTLVVMAPAARAALPYGYLSDVAAERGERFYEIFLFTEPAPRTARLSDAIFNRELSKEFQDKYRDKFGTLDTESIAYKQTDFSRLDENKGNNQKLETQSAERKVFAEYMVKRLAEWHVDNYIKSEPAMRPVYEAKERLKKIEVKVTKETKLEARYSFAGNILELIYDNPICDLRVISEMDPSAFGPTSPRENTYILKRPITTSLRAENSWTQTEGRGKLDFIKVHRSGMSTSLGMSAAYKAGGVTPRDSRLSMGLGYSF